MKRFLFLISWITVSVVADQPIMNMMPRWDGGYGWQVLYDTIHREDLLRGESVIESGWSETVHQVHLQGVYTWDRAIRITAKLPLVLDAERVNLVDNNRVVQRDEGVGDLTLALPLKRYFNLMKRTGNWTVAPQVRVPMGSKDEYDVYDRVWGGGLFAGYETEMRYAFFAAGGSYWVFETEEPEAWHSSVDAGWNFRDNAQLLWETDWHYETDGKRFVSAGPALYWRHNDNTHLRFEYKREFNGKTATGELDHIGGDRIVAGVGFVY